MQLTRFGKAKTSTFIEVKRKNGNKEYYKVKENETEPIDEETYLKGSGRGKKR